MTKLKNSKTICLLLLAGLVAFAGCDRDDDVEVTSAAQPQEQAPQPAAQPMDDDHDVDEADHDDDMDEAHEQGAPMAGKPGEKIAQARCQREQKCQNIGAEKDYKSMGACVSEVSKEWRDDLNKYECPGGVEEDELSECLEEVRNEDCANPFDTLGRVVACRASDICS